MTLRPLEAKKGAGLVFLLALIYSVYLHHHLGMDGFWDTANYHWYLGWAFWHVPAYGYGAVAQYQTFLNPVIDAVNYALFSIHPFLGAAFHSVCLALTLVIVYRIAVNALFQSEGGQFGPAIATVISATGAMTVSLFGSFTNEHITALLIVAGLGLLIGRDAGANSGKTALAAGLLVGFAAGCKLTAAPYVAGLLATFVLVARFRIKPICMVVIGTGLGLLLADGVFMAIRWYVYHNPIFPLANNIFHSSYFPLEWKSFSHFEWRALPYYLSLPVRWLYSGDLSESNVVRDGRLLLGYIGIVLTVVSVVFQRKPLRNEERFVIFFFVFSWLAWILFFRIYRYLVVLELISGIVFLIGMLRIVPPVAKWPRIGLSVLAIGFLLVVTVYPDWGRRAWGKQFAASDVSKHIAHNDSDVVFFADERLSYLATELDTMKIPFRNLFSQSWYDGDRKGNPIDPKPFALTNSSKAYFLEYSTDDPRTRSVYLANLFSRHLYKCEPLTTNMLWSPSLCRFEPIRDIPRIELGRTYDHASTALVFGAGWSTAEPSFRWSEGHASSIWFSLPEVPAACQLSVSLTGHTLGKQRIRLEIAGQVSLNQEFTGPVDATLRLDNAKLSAGQPVEMKFDLPDAASPNNGDPRVLGFALQSLSLQCK